MPAEGPLDGEGSVCDWKVKQANARGEILEAGGGFPPADEAIPASLERCAI